MISVIQLREALREAISEVSFHSQEYNHRTPPELRERWAKVLAEADETFQLATMPAPLRDSAVAAAQAVAQARMLENKAVEVVEEYARVAGYEPGDPDQEEEPVEQIKARRAVPQPAGKETSDISTAHTRRYALSRMAQMERAPHLWGHGKEAFMAQLCLLLDLAGVRDTGPFQEYCINGTPGWGGIAGGLLGDDGAWARSVVSHARGQVIALQVLRDAPDNSRT